MKYTLKSSLRGAKLKIGIDLDGVITPIGLINPSVKLPRWLYIFIVPIVLLMVTNKKEELKEITANHQIIIISARPAWCKNLTEKWLKYHQVPFDKLYCVGFGKGTKQRKLRVIEKEKIEVFVDDNSRTREFLNLNGNSVKAVSQLQSLNGPI